jgi:hypothetical protein
MFRYLQNNMFNLLSAFMQPIMQLFLSVKTIVIEKVVHSNTMASIGSPVKILLCSTAVECDPTFSYFSYIRKDNRTVVIPSVV